VASWGVQLVNGAAFGLLLFLLAAGLTLIFGLMRIINMAHGSYYLVGAYLGLAVGLKTGNFFLALLAGGVSVAAMGAVMHRYLLKRFYGHTLDKVLPQVLLTFGFLFILADLSMVIWGGHPKIIPPPAWFQRSVSVGSTTFPSYRLFVIAVGLATAAALYWFQERTRYGAMIRAAVDDEETARARGINVSLMFTLVFALGALLAGFSGVIGGPLLGVYPGVDFEVLLYAFIVVTLGGLGSLKGAFVASLLVGIVDSLGKVLFPELALFSLFLIMVVVLVLRPQGLFGRA